MVPALIASLIVVVIIIVIALIAYRVRLHRKSTHSVSGHEFNTVDTVVSAPTTHGKGGFNNSSTQISSTHSGSGSVGEKLHTRFLAMSILAAGVFGSLVAKLWSMQIMQSAEYARKAQANLYTTVSTPAPRGVIYDAGGIELVRNRASLTVLAEASVGESHEVLLRLSTLLGLPYEVVRQRVLSTATGAQNRRVVASDVSLRSIAYISEHSDAFPGVTTETRTLRQYPWVGLAAHVLGYAGTVSEEEIDSVADGREVELGDVVGKAGVEATYESVLAGDHGQRVLVTGADGEIQQVVSETNPVKGNDVFLTIRAQVQHVADQYLATLIAPTGSIGSGTGSGGSLVCMDVTNGDVIALSNFPTYSPESFIGGISQDVWDSFNTEESHYPLMDRAVAGTYPAASTFKAFTGMAGLEYGFATATSTWDCGGTWIGFGSDYPQHCWNLSGHGTLDLVGGIINSCDVVFYEIAKSFYDAREKIGLDAMQDFVKKFGFGSPTGIDLAGEASGRIPTPEWKAEYYKDAPEEAAWLPGDMTNMVIGQGNVLITPLQLAVGYGGIATGKLVKPHVLKEVKNSVGGTVLKGKEEVTADLDLNQEKLKIIHEGLKGVITHDSDAWASFSKYDFEAAGKSGTAEVFGKDDYGWFVAYAPVDNPKYVCACVVEEGKGGAKECSPVCADVLNACLEYDKGTLEHAVAPVQPIFNSIQKDSSVALSGTTSTASTRTD